MRNDTKLISISRGDSNEGNIMIRCNSTHFFEKYFSTQIAYMLI